MFETYFPDLHKLGMSEEQFWRSNPRIWKVWQEAYKQKITDINKLNWYNGMYMLNAVTVALDNAFNGRKSKSEYMKEPIRIFDYTEEERKEIEKQALEQAIAFFNNMEKSKNNKVV